MLTMLLAVRSTSSAAWSENARRGLSGSAMTNSPRQHCLAAIWHQLQNRFYWPDGRVSFLPNANLEHCRHALMGSSVRGATFRRAVGNDFYVAVVAALADLRIKVKIGEWPNEVPDPIRFSEDRTHAAYDPEYARRFWRILLQVDRVFKLFRTGFIGKCSPVHFFWGSFDLAVTRFSGRPAPLHPGGIPNLSDEVVREAYSHEVSSAGVWPGGGIIEYPAFYSYAYPEPAGFRSAATRPKSAFYSEQLREFILPYDVVRAAEMPDETLLEFLQSTYEAAADFGNWHNGAR